ncbi:MAG: hypothetical protein HXN76_01880 [Prevotella pallens]|uniref:hypothetical protein n=1 Tax=Prevotella pallens TaxID=60133 RepID=UPI001CB16AA1|nr:hypothetical protein [Prevotella pallens]MBF1491459.1 hypothetical protein [Prevotella pallens]
MSSYRRHLAAIANKLICGIDFSKQPDNELWYITTDGQKAKSILPTYGGQTMTVLSHTYENGIGKVTYKEDLVNIGQRVLQDNNLILVSMPKKVINIGIYCCNGKILILHNEQKVVFNMLYLQQSGTLYVQPNCARYYKDFSYNVIEKKI